MLELGCLYISSPVNRTFVEKSTVSVSVSIPIGRSPAMKLHDADVLAGPLAAESHIKG
jgi:hypothetical protein